MQNFITLLSQIFPSVTDDVATNTVKAIQSNFVGVDKPLCITPFALQAQGDIYFGDLPFRIVGDDGSVMKRYAPGLLLTNTCDTERDERLSFAALLPLESYVQNGLNRNSITNNEYTKLLYIPSGVAGVDEYVVDFTIINSISRLWVEKQIEEGKIARMATLSLLGYYMFLLKFSVFFMRPEDPETHALRPSF